MPSAYKIDKQDGAYFITSTIVGWIDLFIRDSYKQLIADSLNFCVEKKGLQIYAYVIMPSHLHLIASAKNNDLSDVIGSFKKFTSNKLLNNIKTSKESRRDWMLPVFKKAGEENPRNSHYQIWQQDNPACLQNTGKQCITAGRHAEEVYSPKFTLTKIKYIHNNPVEEGFVERPEDYLYSSAKDYSGMKSPVNVSLINLHSLF